MAYNTPESVADYLSRFQRKRFPLTAKRTIWKTAGMGLMVTPRKRTIEMHSRL
jgi:hypothetical protein